MFNRFGGNGLSRARRLGGLAGACLALVFGAMAFWTPSAWAVDDQVDSWQIAYTVNDNGVVHVDETLVYRFGSNSGRHGIDRILTTREAWGSEDLDAVYTISDVQVTSPDASAQFALSTLGSGRDQQLRIRIGSADRVITSATATYTLSYDVAGAMRSSDNATNPYDEFYWDAISDQTPLVQNITITVKVPGGAQDVFCASGPVKSNNACTSAAIGSDGVATFTEASKSAGDIMTISTMIKSGLVSNTEPNLQPRADKADAEAQTVGLAATGGTAVVTAVGVGLLARRNRRDDRFIGVAPGSIDDSGQGVGPDDHPVIPVCFAPPAIPVASAGLLDDGAVDVRDTTATLLSLAVRGAIQLRQDDTAPKSWVFGGTSTGTNTIYARQVRTDVPVAPHEAKMLDDLFYGVPVGHEKALTGQGTLTDVHMHMQRNVRSEAEAAGWYKRLPGGSVTPAVAGSGAAISSVLRFFVVVMVAAGFGLFSWIGGLAGGGAVPQLRWLAIIGPLVVLLVGFIVYKGLTHRGQRSAVGRAYTDQIDGFREYLATAEADQIKFEEGQDIFSQYLPWAVIFELTDRWTKICAQLVELGRLSNVQPTWYYGDYRTFNVFMFTGSINSLNQAAMPVVQASSGSGFGGGSAFGGGGFSGGGGGGGGVGSW